MTNGTETLEIREFSTKSEKNDGAPNTYADITVEINVDGRTPEHMGEHMQRIVTALTDEYEDDPPVRIRTADGTEFKAPHRLSD
jgi:hypothetical protein